MDKLPLVFYIVYHEAKFEISNEPLHMTVFYLTPVNENSASENVTGVSAVSTEHKKEVSWKCGLYNH